MIFVTVRCLTFNIENTESKTFIRSHGKFTHQLTELRIAYLQVSLL